jgi:HSP20 family protein
MRRNVFEELEEIMDRMSDQLEGSVGAGGLTSVPVDVEDRGDAFVLTADLPGFEGEDVELTLSGRQLQLRADPVSAPETESEAETPTGEEDKKTETTVEPETTYVQRERRRSTVKRTVHLPEDVVEEDVSASLDRGVLTVTLPKVHADVEDGQRIEIDD